LRLDSCGIQNVLGHSKVNDFLRRMLADLCERLGVGIGWNPVEHEALGTSFADRAARYEEQMGLLRQLWTEPENLIHHGPAAKIAEEVAAYADAGIDLLVVGGPTHAFSSLTSMVTRRARSGSSQNPGSDIRLSSSSMRPRLEATSKIASERLDPLLLGLQPAQHLGHTSSHGEGAARWDGPVIPRNTRR
jgi:hypothetical protein